MKRFTLLLLSFVLVTSSFGASPTIAVKSKSKIKIQSFTLHFANAVNTTTGQTLVLWTENGPVEAVLISPKGKVLGRAFVLANNLMFGTSIAFNPSTQEYFVAYVPFDRSIVPYGSIFAIRLDQHGKRIGKEFTVLEGVKPEKPDDLGDNAFPHLIFNPKTNGYVIIWERTEGIAAALLDANGKLTSPTKIIAKNPSSNGYYDTQRGGEGRIKDVQWVASGKKLLVLFEQRVSDVETNNWLAVIDPLLKSTAKISKISTSPVGGYWFSSEISLGILPGDARCVFYTDQGMVLGRTMNSKGRFTSVPFPAFSRPNEPQLRNPKVAFSTTSAGRFGVLIAYENVPESIIPQNAWAQVIDDHCHPVGDAKVVDTNLHDYTTGAYIFALPQGPTDNALQFMWMQGRSGPISPSNIFKLKLQVTP